MTTAAVQIDSRPTLFSLLTNRAPGREIAAHLDSLAPYSRVEQVTAVGGNLVGRLYEAAAGNDPLTLEDFVPKRETGTVIFEGKNSLPMFTRFQKRFARVGEVVIGYNHQTMAFATGPGYFVVRPPTEGEVHPDELFFDYTMDPPRSGKPADWPTWRPNTSGLSRAVYAHMKDYCRRVANGVLVGKAYKNNVAQGAFFTLTLPY
jgi:hypothetical protein